LGATWYRPLRRAIWPACYLVAHALVALLIIGLISFIQYVLKFDGDPKLFDVVPLRYLFDVMDIAILLLFLVFGTLEGIQVFRETDNV
jgi:hypothetical protein